MNATEIMLIMAGIIVMLLGYVIPAKKKDLDDDIQLISENEVRKLIDKELEGAKEHISDIIDETVTYAIEKTERSMERLANEKIMAINEYSDTVLEEINKNHKEVLFLYDMLNDKHEDMKTTMSESRKIVEEVRQTLKDAEITAREAAEAARGIEETAKEIEETAAKEAEETAKSRIDTIFDDGFVPIMPPRVEIIHDPDGEYDYVAPEAVPSEEETEKAPKRAKRPRKTSQFESENRAPGKRKKSGEDTRDIKSEKGLKDKNDAQTQGAGYDAWNKFVPVVNEEIYALEASEENYDIFQTDENESTRNSNERILELHKAGKSNMAIAKELGLGIGEVKLVIDLFEGL